MVTELGAALLSWRRTETARGHWQGTQLKAPADDLAHQFLCGGLGQFAPDIPVVSEEDAASHAGPRPRRYFLIDPIDGTASFAGGFDGFVTQVALMEDARPDVAAVFAPALNLLYLAERKRGATVNGRPIRVAAGDDRLTLIDNNREPRGTARRAFAALGCTGYLESGSISLKICRVADGSADLFFKDTMVRDWDLAAPHLVLAEAGGRLSALDGSAIAYTGGFEKPGVVAAGRPGLSERLVRWLDGRAADQRMEVS